MPTEALRDVNDQLTLNEALASERAILYKHSTTCPVSAWVIQTVLQFAELHHDWPIYLLKVIEQRALSDMVAERFEVRHQSPQIFVIKGGRCVWHASHSAITTESLSRQTA
jgi:bacillithiol system protein YtxJ